MRVRKVGAWRMLALSAALVLLLAAVGVQGMSALGITHAERIAALQSATPVASSPAEPGRPVVRFYLFYSQTCPHCHEVMENYLPTVYEKYGAQVEHQDIDLYNNSEAYLTMLGLETKLGVPDDQQGSVPALVIGDRVLIGSVEIPAKLETLIDEYLAKGGVDYPSLEDLPKVVLPTPAPTVQALLFFDRGHADFQKVNETIIALGSKYGDGFQVYGADLSQTENTQLVAQIDAALGVQAPPPGTPQLLIDRRMLIGREEIQRELPGLVERYLAQGGIALPAIEELLVGRPQGAAPTQPPVTATAKPPIHLAYFYKAGCQECDRAANDLNFIQQTYPQVQISRYNIEENQALAEWLGERIGVPQAERLLSPAIFVGNDHLIGDRLALPEIQSTVGKYAASGAAAIWEQFDPESQSAARESLIERYKSLGALTVVGAGLVNGLNPCAFVTIVFFLSYLTFMGRRGRDILLVGAMFTLGVFVAYLLAGLGLTRLLEPLSGVQATLKLWVLGLTALLCLALAGISLHDYVKARQGKTEKMKLKLSTDLRKRVNKVIREGAKMRAFYLVAFGVGAIVSLIQLTCTSPIYIGILFLIHDVPEMQSNAYLYLLLYNLAYILPLVVIFLLAYFGTSSEKLGSFITKRTAAIKLATVVVFLVLAGWLIYSLVPLIGSA